MTSSCRIDRHHGPRQLDLLRTADWPESISATTASRPTTAGDGDTGAEQPAELPGADRRPTRTAAGTTIVGTLNSNANTTLSHRVLRQPAERSPTRPTAKASATWASSPSPPTASGNASVNTTLANVWVNSGDRITATATVDLGGGNYGSTSEFAANVTATSTGIIVVDTTSDVVRRHDDLDHQPGQQPRRRRPHSAARGNRSRPTTRPTAARRTRSSSTIDGSGPHTINVGERAADDCARR
ncbi:MAG: hypothetical protein MZV64_19955 [Ignavibacteriales bacterium]|nr:hypothetical protein [Ignavibacteriales bacterium]